MESIAQWLTLLMTSSVTRRRASIGSAMGYMNTWQYRSVSRLNLLSISTVNVCVTWTLPLNDDQIEGVPVTQRNFNLTTVGLIESEGDDITCSVTNCTLTNTIRITN
jgi:hypothetical protein